MTTTQGKRVCIICGGNHLAHRCAITRQIRDRDISPPSQLCLKHCGEKTEECNDDSTNKCYIFRTQNGSIIDLTCGHSNHGLRHFLLCESENCCNKSEAFWNRREVRTNIVIYKKI